MNCFGEKLLFLIKFDFSDIYSVSFGYTLQGSNIVACRLWVNFLAGLFSCFFWLFWPKGGENWIFGMCCNYFLNLSAARLVVYPAPLFLIWYWDLSLRLLSENLFLSSKCSVKLWLHWKQNFGEVPLPAPSQTLCFWTGSWTPTCSSYLCSLLFWLFWLMDCVMLILTIAGGCIYLWGGLITVLSWSFIAFSSL